MKSTLTKRGQTVISSALRRRYRIETGMTQWIDTGRGIRVVPVPRDPIAALRGSGKGEGLVGKLLRARKADRWREEVKRKRGK